MSKALYRKYRSKSLEEVIGQSHVTDILAKAIAQNKISHAYLLTGPRGVGKTSIARILAYQINGLPYDEDASNLDIIEIDAASNNGVEDVRDLKEKVQIAPVAAKKKIYIIDEVHMLSKAAFNALLKTLEEPPEHVVFILATTDLDKLPSTIISRTQRFGFRSISTNDIVKHLRFIAESEKIKISDEALELIAVRGDGSFRDSISLLDQLSSLSDEADGITASLVETSLGLAPKALIDAIVNSVSETNLAELVKILGTAQEDGIGSVTLAQQLTQSLRSSVLDHPQYLSVIDNLLDVTKSSQPDLKLLAVLGNAVVPKVGPKTVALSAPALEVSASIADLARQATQDKPKEVIQKALTPVVVVPIAKPTVEAKKDDIKIASAQSVETKAQHTDTKSDFDWNKLIEHARQNYVAIYSVLSKCQFDINEMVLTLYTNNKFYKKKLDDSKYSGLIHESLNAIGVYGLEIITIPTAPPPKDSQAAAVAAIMGGGEEVSLEENGN